MVRQQRAFVLDAFSFVDRSLAEWLDSRDAGSATPAFHFWRK